MTILRRLGLLAVAALLVATGSACGGKALAGAASCADPADPVNHQTIAVPPALAGLTLGVDATATQKLNATAKRNSYVCDGVVLSLRAGKELRAVLQVARLTADARPDQVEFRRKVAAQIGGTSRRPTKLGDTLVYTAHVNTQIIDVWFTGRFMLVLIVMEKDAAGSVGGLDFLRLRAEAVSLEPVRA